MRRKNLTRKANKRIFSRGNRVNKRNNRIPVTQRGGYRI